MRAGWVPFLHAVLFLLFLLQLLAFFGILGEDCFITFRYARNLAEGRGLVYNPGEYVEGISNPYWAFCLAGLYGLGLSMTFACALLVFVHAAAAYAVTAAASVAWFGRRSWFSLLPPLMLCAMTILPAGYQNGLEGSAVALGVALVCLGAAGDRPAVLVAGVAVLLGNRPGAPGYAALAVLWLVARALRAEGRARVSAFAYAGVIAALVAGMVLLRYGYYGDIVPNTLRAKGSIPFSANLRGGARYLAGYVRLVGPWMFLFAAAAAAGHGRRRGAGLLLSFTLLNAAVVVRNGGDWMAHYRLLTPLFGAFALLAAAGFAWCWRAPSRALRTVLAALFVAGVARLPDWAEVAANVREWPGRLDKTRSTPDGGNYPVDNHVTGPVMGREPDDLLLAENGGRVPYLLKEVRVLEMAGLTDRDLVSGDSPCRDCVGTIGVYNWHGIFTDKKPTYVQFPPPDIGRRLSRLLECPEVAPSLDLFIVAQNTSRLHETDHLDLLMVRSDRRSLGAFIRDFGAFVPAADMARGYQKGPAPAPESWRDITVGSWALEAWRDARTGEPLSDSWGEWLGRERAGAEMALSPGINRFNRPLRDGGPLLVVVDLPPGVPGDTRLTFSRTGSGESWAISSAGPGFSADKYRCQYLFIPEGAPALPEELQLDAETSADCRVRVCVSRWTSGPAPALPEAHIYPDKSDCRGMIARRTLLPAALEHMTALYLEENDLDGLLAEWDGMDPAVFPPALRHCARGRAFEESGRSSDALGEYRIVTDGASAARWGRVPEGLQKWLSRIPACAGALPDRWPLQLALEGESRILAAGGDVAGAEAAQLAAVFSAGGSQEALDVLYSAHFPPGEAAAKWRAVAAAHPDDAWTRFFLSRACARVPLKEDALQEARAARALGPGIPVFEGNVAATLQELAGDCLSQGRYAEALPLCREMGGEAGKLGEAKALAALGDAPGAEAAYLSVILAGPGARVLEAYEGLDALYAASSPPGERPAKWLDVARRVPDQPWPHVYRGCALDRLSRGAEAQEAYAQAAAALLAGLRMRGD